MKQGKHHEAVSAKLPPEIQKPEESVVPVTGNPLATPRERERAAEGCGRGRRPRRRNSHDRALSHRTARRGRTSRQARSSCTSSHRQTPHERTARRVLSPECLLCQDSDAAQKSYENNFTTTLPQLTTANATPPERDDSPLPHPLTRYKDKHNNTQGMSPKTQASADPAESAPRCRTLRTSSRLLARSPRVRDPNYGVSSANLEGGPTKPWPGPPAPASARAPDCPVCSAWARGPSRGKAVLLEVPAIWLLQLQDLVSNTRRTPW